MHGICSYADVHRLSLEDFYNMNEILQIKHENERLAEKAAAREQKKGR